jgi:hypothetical protein
MDKYHQVPDNGAEDEDSTSSSSSSDPDTVMSNTDRLPPPPPSSANPTNPLASIENHVPERKTKQVYTGRRISTGSAMPPNHRDETVSALVESVVWAFNCQVRIPTMPPRISVRNLLFPVRQSFVVGRVPREKEMARRGVLEGPVMGICSRVETEFHDLTALDEDGRAEGRGGDSRAEEGWKEILDLAREVAVMLLVAQERAREGREEVKPGEGKWWTTEPRWGGGRGASMEDDIPSEPPPGDEKLSLLPGNAISDEQPTPKHEAGTVVPEETRSARVRPKRKANADINPGSEGSALQHRKGSKINQAERWKILRPGPGIWDRKMKYLRIGGGPPASKAPQSQSESYTANTGEEPEEEEEEEDDDDIFLVTAVNHHVALMNMRVSGRYLGWLAGDDKQPQVEKEKGEERGGRSLGQERTEVERSGLRVKRTRWFDLFDEGDRVEFVMGLWGVMEWLMR